MIFKLDAFLFIILIFLIFKVGEALLKYFILFDGFKRESILKIKEKIKNKKMEEILQDKKLKEELNLYILTSKKYFIYSFIYFFIIFMISKEIFDHKYKYLIIGKFLFWENVGFLGGFILVSLTYLIIVSIINKYIKNEKIKSLLL